MGKHKRARASAEGPSRNPCCELMQEENFELQRENARLNDELKLRDEKLRNREAELEKSRKENNELKAQFGRMTVGKRIFPHFTSLPSEVRQLVYAKLKLNLVDRVSAAGAALEMEQYFMKNRMERNHVRMSVAMECNKFYVKVEFWNQWYTEMHQIPERYVDNAKRDILTSVGCQCAFCENNHVDELNNRGRRSGEMVQLKYFAGDDASWSTDIFQSLWLVDIEDCYIKSAPVGGLVDLLQPSDCLLQAVENLNITWHVEHDVQPLRNDPNFVAANWGRWLAFMQPESIYIRQNTGCQLHNRWAGFKSRQKVVLYQSFFNLQPVRNAKTLNFKVISDVSLHQLMSLSAVEIFLNETNPNILPRDALRMFHEHIVQKWLRNPEIEYRIYMSRGEVNGRMLEDYVRGQGVPDTVLVYEGLNCFWPD